MKGKIFGVLLMLSLWACKDESSDIGDKYFKDGQYEEAISAYNKYLQLKPKHIKSLYNRGRAHEELGKLDEAITDFKSVLEEDPNNVNALMSIGKDAFYRKTDFESALYYFDRAIEHDTENMMAYTFRGKSNQKLGNLKEAMSDFNAAISIDKTSGEPYLSRGALKMALKDKGNACADFKLAKNLGSAEADKAIKKYCH